jgi:hypothetical protein
MVFGRRVWLGWVTSTCLLAMACGSEHGREPVDAATDMYPRPLGGRAHADLTLVAGAVRSQPPSLNENGVVVEPPAVPPTMATVTFKQTTAGIDMLLDGTGCQIFAAGYPVRIHAGTTCTDAAGQGPVWDGARGETGVMLCMGQSQRGLLYYTRSSSDPHPWTLGGASASNILSHVLVIHDPVSDAPLACGVIVEAPAAPPPPAESLPSTQTQAQIAGLCTFNMLVTTSTKVCPDPSKLSACAAAHCGLYDCLNPCADYASCLEQQPGVCDFSACATSEACGTCTSDVFRCVVQLCNREVSCSEPPTPGGPCTKLRNCCQKQGDFAANCIAVVANLEHLSGDPSCIGAMQDWDFNTHLPVPCDYTE